MSDPEAPAKMSLAEIISKSLKSNELEVHLDAERHWQDAHAQFRSTQPLGFLEDYDRAVKAHGVLAQCMHRINMPDRAVAYAALSELMGSAANLAHCGWAIIEYQRNFLWWLERFSTPIYMTFTKKNEAK